MFEFQFPKQVFGLPLLLSLLIVFCASPSMVPALASPDVESPAILATQVSGSSLATSRIPSSQLAKPPVTLGTVESGQEFYSFSRIREERLTSSGRIRAYEMYVPKKKPGAENQSFPIVVLLHGFLRTPKHMLHNAEYLAKRGIFVLVPQMDQLLWGYEKRGRNMAEVGDQIRWFLPRASDPNDELYGAFDASRLGMLGHSSGGPICVEVVIDLQKHGIAVDSMMMPDGIVWERTMDALPQLKPLDVFSVRSEPAICNQHASVFRILEKLPFPYRDLKVNGARHCDPENPTNWGCQCICGPTNDKYRAVFVRLMYVYFKDRLKSPSTPDSQPTLEATINQFQSNRIITIGPSQPAARVGFNPGKPDQN